MDRDKRWERVELSYNAITDAEGMHAADALSAVDAAYNEGVTDEFIKPFIIGDYGGINDGDGLIMANFRADRARQLLTALTDNNFDGFKRNKVIKFSGILGMVEYSAKLAETIPAIFQPENVEMTLGELVANAGLKQLRISETEKYPHVTYFFNGGAEGEFNGEERIMVPSPKVATYDLQPEMSAYEMTDKLVAAIDSGNFDLIVVNYANTDMVGHSGNIEAAKKAVEAVDSCLGKLVASMQKAGGAMIISADHGNAEMMTDNETGQPHTAHTLNKVPFIIVGEGFEKNKVKLKNGILADIAPTILSIMELPKPTEMTGSSLITLDHHP